MAIRDIIKKQRESGKSISSSINYAIASTALEKVDPRNYLFKSGGLLNTFFPGVKGFKAGGTRAALKEKISPELVSSFSIVSDELVKMNAQLSIIGKNSMALPVIMQDMKVTKQSLITLVKLAAESQREKADQFFLGAAEMEEKYERRFEDETKPTPVKEKEKEGKDKSSVLGILSSLFSMLGTALTTAVSLSSKLIGKLIDAGKLAASLYAAIKAFQIFKRTPPVGQPGRTNLPKTPTEKAPDKTTGKTPTEKAPDKTTGKTPTEKAPDKTTGKTPTEKAPDKTTGKTPTEKAPNKPIPTSRPLPLPVPPSNQPPSSPPPGQTPSSPPPRQTPSSPPPGQTPSSRAPTTTPSDKSIAKEIYEKLKKIGTSARAIAILTKALVKRFGIAAAGSIIATISSGGTLLPVILWISSIWGGIELLSAIDEALEEIEKESIERSKITDAAIDKAFGQKPNEVLDIKVLENISRYWRTDGLNELLDDPLRQTLSKAPTRVGMGLRAGVGDRAGGRSTAPQQSSAPMGRRAGMGDRARRRTAITPFITGYEQDGPGTGLEKSFKPEHYGHLTLLEESIKSLGDLKFFGEELNIPAIEKSLGNLKFFGEELNIPAIEKSLGNLKFFGEELNIPAIQKSLGDLKFFGEELNIPAIEKVLNNELLDDPLRETIKKMSLFETLMEKLKTIQTGTYKSPEGAGQASFVNRANEARIEFQKLLESELIEDPLRQTITKMSTFEKISDKFKNWVGSFFNKTESGVTTSAPSPTTPQRQYGQSSFVTRANEARSVNTILQNQSQLAKPTGARKFFGEELNIPNTKEMLSGAMRGLVGEPPTENVSQDLVNYIIQTEKFSPKPFRDGKNNRMSIGYGTMARPGDVEITEEEARKRMLDHIKVSKKEVINYMKKHNYNLNNREIEALTSFTYNAGLPNLIKLTGNGKRTKDEIAEKMKEYVYSDNVRMPGLDTRRGHERKVFTGEEENFSSFIQNRRNNLNNSIRPRNTTPNVRSDSTSLVDSIVTAMGSAPIIVNAPVNNMQQSAPVISGGKASSYDEDFMKMFVEQNLV
jgi:GH24 family phage-related lysozyme (muramidase)